MIRAQESTPVDTVLSPAQLNVRPPRAPRVPMGPPWWGAVMGTGIIGTLTQLHAGTSSLGATSARFFLIAAWVLMVAFAFGFVARIIRSAHAWKASVTGVGSSAWGMVSMGILAVGSATSNVLPAWKAKLTGVAWQADETLWIIATTIGFLSTFGFLLAVLKHRPTEPRPTWGLAIVPPMVSATCGAPFVARIGSSSTAFAFLTLLAACFVCSLTLGIVIFTAAYRHHLRFEAIPVALAASSWIPLGVVGQSTAAAQSIAVQSSRFLTSGAVVDARHLADIYGYVMLTIAVPLVIFAIVITVRGAMNHMPFSPGWWALTFPIGTLSLGALDLSKGSGLQAYATASTVTWVALLCTWTFCAVASLASLRRPRQERTA